MQIFKWRYDRRIGNCNLSHCKFTRKQFGMYVFYQPGSNLSCNKSGWCKFRNTVFWLDKITRESHTIHTGQVCLGPQHARSLFQKVELLSTVCNNVSQPATNWFVARQAWLLDGKTRIIAVQLNLQQCRKKTSTFLAPVFLYLYFTSVTWKKGRNKTTYRAACKESTVR